MTIPRSVHPLPGESEREARLLSLVDRFNSRRLLVIGDIVADEFVFGKIARISREAPVLILEHDATETLPGGAGNAANNAAALGAEVSLIGLAGDPRSEKDGASRRMVKRLNAGVDASGLVRPRGYEIPVKTRILAGGVHSAKQQIVRVDRIARFTPDERTLKELMRNVDRALATCDGVLVSDYGSGVVTPALVRRIRAQLTSRTRRNAVPLLLDSRYALLKYRGVTACTPNESEVEQLLGVRIGDDRSVLERAGRTMLRRTSSRAVLVTRGSRGMALFEPDRRTVHIPIWGSDEVTDVTGAGDTVIATMALALSAGGSFYEAARLANYAGGLVVMKRGTATITADELRDAVTSDHAGTVGAGG